MSKRYGAPKHIAQLGELFQRIIAGDEVRAVTSVPPRHGKSELLIHGIAWLLLQRPWCQICYASYAARVAEKKSRRARKLAEQAGVPLARDSKSRQNWRTKFEEGGVWATSVDGQITSEGFHVIILDDLIKGRAEAESVAIRDRTREWLIADVITRLEPGGSVILNGTRWHPEDPIGWAIAQGWEVINLPALDADDNALWPERWTAERLKRIRHELGGPQGYEWLSLYMGAPIGRDTRVFGGTHLYEKLPDLEGARIAIGLDFAYSMRTAADWSVAVVIAEIGKKYYVLDVVRKRCDPREFREHVKKLLLRYPGALVRAYPNMTEMGGIEFIRDAGIFVDAPPALVDKFQRAIPFAAAWNVGDVFVPQSAPWVDAFVSELCAFTGVKDRHDDQVDAGSAAFDGVAVLQGGLPRGKLTGGERPWSQPQGASPGRLSTGTEVEARASFSGRRSSW